MNLHAYVYGCVAVVFFFLITRRVQWTRPNSTYFSSKHTHKKKKKKKKSIHSGDVLWDGGGMSNSSPNFFTIVSEYVDHMLPADNSMKVLLVDEATLNIISMACSQTFLLKRGVFLVSCVNEHHHQRRRIKNMRCVAFIRPQVSSVELLCSELLNAKYESYAIHFSTAASSELLDRLACADVENLVTRVTDVFCDFDTLNADAFLSAGLPNALIPSFLSAVTVQRIAEGIAATFVALRRRPHVRFQQNSAFARRVALELGDILDKSAELYNYKNKDSVLIILDRCSDALTPLVTPWTYQAMLHEHIGLQHNRLELTDTTREKEEYVFSQQDDPFFAANMFANWGELCSNVKKYVDTCKSALNIDRSTATMDEIKDFMQKLPQTKNLTGSVTKHATVVSHLSSIVKRRGLLDVSLLEQDMIASSNASDHWNRLRAFAERRNGSATNGDAVVDPDDLLRLCLIYHLRYEKGSQNSRVLSILEDIGPGYASCLRKLQQYCGEYTTDELFGVTSVMASLVKTFVDSTNIYTQHEPVLKRTLLQLFGDRLSLEQYPYLTPPSAAAPHGFQTSQQSNFRPKEVIVFMCGGFTYEEASLVDAINAGTAYTGSAASSLPQGGVRVTIGGTAVLNSKSFLSLLTTQL